MSISRRKFVFGSAGFLSLLFSGGLSLARPRRDPLLHYHSLFSDKDAAMRIGWLCAVKVPRYTLTTKMREVKHALLDYEKAICELVPHTRRRIVSASIKRDFYEANTILIGNLRLSATEIVLSYSFYLEAARERTRMGMSSRCSRA